MLGVSYMMSNCKEKHLSPHSEATVVWKIKYPHPMHCRLAHLLCFRPRLPLLDDGHRKRGRDEGKRHVHNDGRTEGPDVAPLAALAVAGRQGVVADGDAHVVAAHSVLEQRVVDQVHVHRGRVLARRVMQHVVTNGAASTAGAQQESAVSAWRRSFELESGPA
jgi:hypothetical protein